ncbi:hypothetical protein B0T11DRAFT_269878 [Plectosphaerella cucumerina]|uniref:Secreted protein n=1 Tax=Plectosphaerella cucumerina TaxID=40658 RepID=A0A8K0TNP5_9PEZI|nr:hypothetical protein B0T11DRAFT_269878 [Plectosphaerella cucumerina]
MVVVMFLCLLLWMMVLFLLPNGGFSSSLYNSDSGLSFNIYEEPHPRSRCISRWATAAPAESPLILSESPSRPTECTN